MASKGKRSGSSASGEGDVVVQRGIGGKVTGRSRGSPATDEGGGSGSGTTSEGRARLRRRRWCRRRRWLSCGWRRVSCRGVVVVTEEVATARGIGDEGEDDESAGAGLSSAKQRGRRRSSSSRGGGEVSGGARAEEVRRHEAGAKRSCWWSDGRTKVRMACDGRRRGVAVVAGCDGKGEARRCRAKLKKAKEKMQQGSVPQCKSKKGEEKEKEKKEEREGKRREGMTL